MHYWRLVFISCLLLCSCIPARISVTPGLTGHVWDKEKQTAIAGARLHFEKDTSISAQTDEIGHYEIGPVKKWALWVVMGVPVDFRYPTDRVVVTVRGYKPYKTEPVIYSPYTDKLLLQNILLERDQAGEDLRD